MRTELIHRIIKYSVFGIAAAIVAFTTTGCEYFPESTF